MSTNRHLLLCNGATASRSHARRGGGGGEGAEAARERRELWTFGARNVRLTLHDVTDPLGRNLPELVVDLIELAALVYAADQWCPRVPDARGFDYGLHWRRDLRFEVAVRRPDFWNRKAVRDVLVETLTFLSDDDYSTSPRKTKLTPARSSRRASRSGTTRFIPSTRIARPPPASAYPTASPAEGSCTASLITVACRSSLVVLLGIAFSFVLTGAIRP